MKAIWGRTFLTAMGMVEDGIATIKTSKSIYVSSTLAMIDFATNINEAISAGSDVKDIYDILGKAPLIGKSIKNGVALYTLIKKLKMEVLCQRAIIELNT